MLGFGCLVGYFTKNKKNSLFRGENKVGKFCPIFQIKESFIHGGFKRLTLQKEGNCHFDNCVGQILPTFQKTKTVPYTFLFLNPFIHRRFKTFW